MLWSATRSLKRGATNGGRFNTHIRFDNFSLPKKEYTMACVGTVLWWKGSLWAVAYEGRMDVKKRLLLTRTVFTVLINLMFGSTWAGGFHPCACAPLLLLKVIKARRANVARAGLPWWIARRQMVTNLRDTFPYYLWPRPKRFHKQLKNERKKIIRYYYIKRDTNKMINVIYCWFFFVFFFIPFKRIQFHGASKLFAVGSLTDSTVVVVGVVRSIPYVSKFMKFKG